MNCRILVAVFLMLTHFSPVTGIACTCEGEASLLKEYRGTDIVFKGYVVSKRIVQLTSAAAAPIAWNINQRISMPDTMPFVEVRVRVTGWFKGKQKRDTISVFTGFNGLACGVRFEVGKPYIVFGSKEEPFGGARNFSASQNACWTDLCTSSGEWSVGQEEALQKLK